MGGCHRITVSRVIYHFRSVGPFQYKIAKNTLAIYLYAEKEQKWVHVLDSPHNGSIIPSISNQQWTEMMRHSEWVFTGFPSVL